MNAPDDLCDFVPDREALIAAENDRRRMRFPVRLDPELWRPAPQWWPPGPSDLYREYRAANRPFRRAFGGGELRRKALLAVGTFNAKSKEAQS